MKLEHSDSIPDRRFAESQLRRATQRLRESRNMKKKSDREGNIILALYITAIRELAEQTGMDFTSPEFRETASKLSSTAYAIMRVDHEDGTRPIKDRSRA